MTKEEAINHLGFMAKGYQNLLDNDERCLEAVGKGYKGEVEAQESLADVYKAQIDALNLAIKALEQQPCPYWDYELKTCRHANIGALATITPNDVLEKIRAEIEEERVSCAMGLEIYYNEAIDDALRIIDRYKDKGVEE